MDCNGAYGTVVFSAYHFFHTPWCSLTSQCFHPEPHLSLLSVSIKSAQTKPSTHTHKERKGKRKKTPYILHFDAQAVAYLVSESLGISCYVLLIHQYCFDYSLLPLHFNLFLEFSTPSWNSGSFLKKKDLSKIKTSAWRCSKKHQALGIEMLLATVVSLLLVMTMKIINVLYCVLIHMYL